MAKKVTVALQVSYTFKGEVLKDYLEWLDDHRDSKKMREWFVIDRAIGHDQLRQLQGVRLIDPKMKVVISEVDVA